MTAPTIHWFRRDLRLADNAAFSAAAEVGGPVIPVYILDDESPGKWRPGAASRWWLHQSLEALSSDLKALGSRLVIRRGPAVAVLEELIAATGAKAVHWSKVREPWSPPHEAEITDRLAVVGVAARGFDGALLFEPETARNRSGEPFKVFSAFWRAAVAGKAPAEPLSPPKTLAVPARWPKSLTLDSLGLEPKHPDWAGGLRETWTPGEAGAHERLAAFLAGPISDYADMRNRPDIEGTSRLSPHLHHGEISPRQCWHAVTKAMSKRPNIERGAASFLRELGWREFSYYLLHHWPHLPEQDFRPEFAAFPKRQDADTLRAWRKGRTGFPIVDAGMRQLWATGWMHNRVRMIVASFLIKDLMLGWQEGEAWFWDTLVDADLANNAASWQWVAGSGADAAPFFRIFNPTKQAISFDPNGDYVRRWVPELARLPAPDIHAPDQAPPGVLAAAGVVIGETYPAPIVDHADARRRALAAFEALKAG